MTFGHPPDRFKVLARLGGRGRAMLARSFIFLPRIGATLERRLWSRGVTTWDRYLETPLERLDGIGEATREGHRPLLARAREALEAGDPRFFRDRLPSGEQWRCFGELRDRAVYLDIETTGLGRFADVTVVGLRGPFGTRLLVKGEDLTRTRCQELLEEASLLVTFNGATFDLPMLRGKGIEVPEVPHLDLRYALGKLGHRGGLKAIERRLGLARMDDLDELTGADAVRLWREWERRGNAEARATLLDYNRADVENMEPLAEFAYDRLRADRLPEDALVEALP